MTYIWYGAARSILVPFLEHATKIDGRVEFVNGMIIDHGAMVDSIPGINVTEPFLF
jgi:hypothetical protein